MLQSMYMEQFFKFQFVLLVLGAVGLVALGFYVESLDKRHDTGKDKYLKIFKTLLVVYTIWFILSGFYLKFFTDFP